MSTNNNFDSDLEAILAEFSSYSSSISGYAPTQPEAPAAPEESTADTAPARESAEESAPVNDDEGAEYYVDVSQLEDLLNARQKRAEAKKPNAPKPSAAKPAPVPTLGKAASAPGESFTPEFRPSGKSYKPPEAWAKPTISQKRGKSPQGFDPDRYFTDSEKKRAEAIQKKAEESRMRLDEQKSALRQLDRDARREQQRVHDERERAQSPLKTAAAVLFGVLTLLAFCWVGVNVHPDSGTTTAAKQQNNMNLTSKLDVYINNAASDALGDLTYIKKIYKIAETDTVAPKPNEAAFGVTTDIAVIEGVIAAAEELLDGQETVWQPDLPFYPGTEFYYYRDATILVIVWKEIIEERCATISEVKIADGSQFRRKLTEDTYGSSVQLYASELSAAANAVVAMNADYYAYRQTGLTVYQRQLYRNNPGKLDTCFITSTGDMLFVRAGELVGDDAVNQYIAENDVLFSLSFGPVLVENGEAQYCPAYPIGEIDMEYSRAGIGMTDELHYLLMTVNHTDMRPRANVNEFARFMAAKGCVKAFNLDGGQTSEIVFRQTPVNHVDFDAERTVSDIIYFASAIPEKEAAG